MLNWMEIQPILVDYEAARYAGPGGRRLHALAY